MSFEVSLPKINLKQGFINFWPKAKGSSQALVLAQLANTLKQPLIIICNTQSQLARLERELNVFLNHKENPTNIPVISFPDWEIQTGKP